FSVFRISVTTWRVTACGVSTRRVSTGARRLRCDEPAVLHRWPRGRTGRARGEPASEDLGLAADVCEAQILVHVPSQGERSRNREAQTALSHREQAFLGRLLGVLGEFVRHSADARYLVE